MIVISINSYNKQEWYKNSIKRRLSFKLNGFHVIYVVEVVWLFGDWMVFHSVDSLHDLSIKKVHHYNDFICSIDF